MRDGQSFWKFCGDHDDLDFHDDHANLVKKHYLVNIEFKLRESIQLQPDERRSMFFKVLCRLRFVGFIDTILKYLPKMGGTN